MKQPTFGKDGSLSDDQKWLAEMYAKEETKRVTGTPVSQYAEITKRSLGWRLAYTIMVALTATAFIIGWVIVTNITASSRVEIQRISSAQAIEQAKIGAAK